MGLARAASAFKQHILIFIGCIIGLVCVEAGETPSGAGLAYNGDWVAGSGTGDATDWLALLDTARWQYDATPDLQGVPMLYSPTLGALLEGPTWQAWWTQNSYGSTFAALPWLPQPHRAWTMVSQSWWFNNIANGNRSCHDCGGVVAPDGCLCDDGEPTNCNYKQGDGKVPLHDWALEETLSAVVMQSEALLVSRDAQQIQHFLPLFRRTSDLIESRRDNATNHYMAGPASNLLAPSFGGWQQAGGALGRAALTGLSVSYAAALERLIELSTLAGDVAGAQLYGERRSDALEGLNALWAPTGDYLIKSLDPDGTAHGVVGADRHGYLEAVCNHDAVAFNVVNDTQAERIMERLTGEPGLRPYNFTITQYPSLDDMLYPANSSGWLWQFGTWVNGGAWSTCEARMMLAYFRTGRFDATRASMETMMTFAHRWKMDNPLVNFGSEVYQPKEPINNVIDNYGVPAALIRGVLGPRYWADRLELTPRVPPSVASLAVRFPFVFGRYDVMLSIRGNSTQPITSVTVGGAAWAQFSSTTVHLPYAQLPPLPPQGPTNSTRLRLEVNVTFGASTEVWPPAKLSPDDTVPRVPSPAGASNCSLPNGVAARVNNLTAFATIMEAARLAHMPSAAQARLFLRYATAQLTRCEMLANGTLAPLPAATSQAAADAAVNVTTFNMDEGLTQRMASYASTSSPLLQRIYAIWRGQSGA